MYKIERYEAYIPISDLMELYFDFHLTQEKCRQCDEYSKTWSCPSFDFDVAAFWKRFSTLHLIVDRVSNESLSTAAAARDRLAAEKKRFDAEMLELEKQFPGSYGLAAQECAACTKCARLSGLPCLHPEIMRYGLEAIGILALKLVEDKFGFSAQWSDGTSVPDYYLLIGGVILSSEA